MTTRPKPFFLPHLVTALRHRDATVTGALLATLAFWLQPVEATAERWTGTPHPWVTIFLHTGFTSPN